MQFILAGSPSQPSVDEGTEADLRNVCQRKDADTLTGATTGPHRFDVV